MNIEQKLSLDKFVVDEGNPHIVIHQENIDPATTKALTLACPAGLYTQNDTGQLLFEVAGCLECGTCRVICAHLPGALDWTHPRPSFGIQYRCG
jgi:ferredoxin like protein